jgi:hypothetical protein
VRAAKGLTASPLAWSEPSSRDAVGPSRGVARVCRASACACTFSDFTFEVLCGASCDK